MAWRVDRSLEELISYSPENLQKLIIGKTPKFSTSYRGSRYEEIIEFINTELNSGNEIAWLALDDEPYNFHDYTIGENVLIISEPLEGFNKTDFLKSLKMYEALIKDRAQIIY